MRRTHSYGEYVFDWAWAEAYRRYGLRYYPKWLVAVPFTPVPGSRLIAVDDTARARTGHGARRRSTPFAAVVTARAVRAARADRAAARRGIAGAQGRAVPLAQPRAAPYARLRRLPRRARAAEAQEDPRRAPQGARRRRDARAHSRCGDHGGRLGVLLPVLPRHVRGAPLDAVPEPRVLHAPRAVNERQPGARACVPRHDAHRCEPRHPRRRDASAAAAVRPLLGRGRGRARACTSSAATTR